MWLLITFLVIVLVITIGVFVYLWRVYRFKIELWENRGEGFARQKIYRAREIRIPESIDEKVLWVPRAKQYVSAYGRMIAKNTFLMIKAQDGYWYNCVIGDLDAKMGMLDIEPVDRDVRAFHTANQKNIAERYNKAKNWPLILMSFSIILSLIIVFVGGYFMYKQVGEMQTTTAGNLQASQEVSDAAARVVEEMAEAVRIMKINSDTIRAGLVPANSSNG